MDKETVSVFYSYSHRDEELRIELWKHLSALRREGLISDWHDQNIDAGDAWDERIRAQLTGADLILLLVSADFLASEYCYGNELAIALERHRQGKAIVVPIMLRSIDWPSTPFSHLKPLPRNRVPITAWNDCDTAFTSVARDLRKIVDEIIGKSKAADHHLGGLSNAFVPTGNLTYQPTRMPLRLTQLFPDCFEC